MSWRRAILFFVAGGLGGIAALPLAAADQPVAAPAAAANAIIYPKIPAGPAVAAGSSSSYSGVLVVAVLMAGAGGWLFWRGRMTPGRGVPARKLAIAETKSLGNRQYLIVASYEDKKYLLGVCPGRIDLLTPLDGASTAKTP